ncbi:MAG: nucleoside-diphosphate sugar epimerase [Gemmatimonadetes bacterium]|nr:nucleoside-diphosphate sugar epimerase [Gemmatimonadota bacterium]
MHILITGGAGFIGSHLCERLLDRGDRVTIIDDLSTGRFDNIKHLEENERFSWVIDSVLNEQTMAKLIDQADQVYHLAAAVGVRMIVDEPLRSLTVNIRGTEIVLEEANKKKKSVLIASTSEVYGKSNEIPFSEDHDRTMGSTHLSRWSYADAKAVDEYLALAYYREKHLPVVIARLFNTVGPRQTGEYGMVLPRFVKSALLEHPLPVYDDGKQSRCFANVSDVVDGLMKLMDCEKAHGQVFNLGNDAEVTILELAERVKKLTGSTSEIQYIPYEVAYEKGFEDMRRRVPNLAKAREFIGYEPTIDLDTTIRQVIDYFQS